MHESVLAFTAGFINNLDAEWLRTISVLEVGSYNVNGGVRDIIAPRVSYYTGIDIADGPGVDLVMSAEDLDAELYGAHGIVISTEMLEHCERPWVAIHEMARALNHDGLLVLTARGFDSARGAFQFHNPPDRWRFTCDSMTTMIEDTGLRVVTCHDDPQVPGVFAVARRYG